MKYESENQFDEERYRKSVEKAFEQELNEINLQLEKEIIFALVGDVNVGKSSTIDQLMGEEVANVGAKPGETIKVGKYKLKGKDKIIFYDTPGLNDINESNSKETLDFYKEADVILFLLNSAGTVFSKPEKKCFDEIKKVNSQIIIVLNKIDVTSEADVVEQTNFIKDHTGEDFKIVPISSRTGKNIDDLRDIVIDILRTRGKDILFARFLKDKSAIADKWILGAGVAAGSVGLLPIPGSDIIPITSIQVGLLMKLATLYDRTIPKEAAQELVISTIVGNAGKSIFRQLVKLIPGAGPIVGAGVASAMTVALGYAAKYAYENDISLDAQTLKSLFEMFRKQDAHFAEIS